MENQHNNDQVVSPTNTNGGLAAEQQTASPPKPIYPTASAGPVAQSAPLALSESSNTFSKNSLLASAAPIKRNSNGIIALSVSLVAVGVLPLLIFFPKLAGSMGWVSFWLVFVALVSFVGLKFGLASYKDSSGTDSAGFIGTVISIFMLVNCLFVGSYYLKIQITINNIKNKYNNSSIYNSYR